MKKILLLALPLVVMCFASCEKKFVLTNFNAYISEQGGNISAIGGQGYIVYSFTFDKGYNPNVSVTCDKPSWLEYTYEVIPYYNGEQIDVRIDYNFIESNETGEARNATVLVQFDSEQSDSKQYEVNIIQPGIPKVIVSKPGTLTQELADRDLLYASSLKISGELNDKDLETIKGLREIETLDLTDAIIDDLPDEMFYQNETIKNIKLPETITTIHPKTFAFSSLEYIYFPSNIEVIEDGETDFDSYNWHYSGAFANTNLKTMEFAPDSKLRYIGDYAFVAAGEEYYFYYSNTYSYTFDVIFPASVEEIGSNVFSFNSRGNAGTGVDFESREAYIRIAFAKNSELTSIGSIKNYEGISIDASNCTKVEYVGLLQGFDNSISVEIGTQTPPQCGGVSFSSSGGGPTYLYVPKGCVGAYYEADGWKEFETIKEIGQE